MTDLILFFVGNMEMLDESRLGLRNTASVSIGHVIENASDFTPVSYANNIFIIHKLRTYCL